MTVFDGSNRDQCEVERLITNTPIQALVMLNDPTVLEASRVLAAKLLMENADLQANIQKAFRTIVCRQPTEKEMSILTNYHKGRTTVLDEIAAMDLLDVGEYPRPKELDTIELASLMQVIAAIYNLEETISKT
jgi:hypothetical protein